MQLEGPAAASTPIDALRRSPGGVVEAVDAAQLATWAATAEDADAAAFADPR